MLSRCFLDCSVGVGVFVTGLSQISSFSLIMKKSADMCDVRAFDDHAIAVVVPRHGPSIAQWDSNSQPNIT